MNWRNITRKLTDKKVIVSLFLAGIMIFSVFGYVLSYGAEKREKTDYNGFKFESLRFGVSTKINSKEVQFSYMPTQLEDIELTSDAVSILKNIKMISITYDPNSDYSETMAELQYDMSNKLDLIDSIYVQRGLIDNEDYDLPEITCENATQFVPVLELRDGNESKISFEDNCVIAESDNEYEFYKIKDRIIYVIAGVME